MLEILSAPASTKMMKARQLLVVAALAWAVLAAAVPTGAEVPLFAHKLDTLEARCLDGSPGSVYWREGTGEGRDKFVLFLGGGGWSWTVEQLRGLAASKDWRASTDLDAPEWRPEELGSCYLFMTHH